MIYADVRLIGPKYDYNLAWPSPIRDVCGLANEIPQTNGAAGDSSRLVIRGNNRPYVTDFAKRNNIGYAMFARAQGLQYWTILLGPDFADIIRVRGTGTRDDQYARDSYRAGIALMDGDSLAKVMDDFGRHIQHPNMRISKEWPSDKIATTTYISLSTNLINDLERMAGGTP